MQLQINIQKDKKTARLTERLLKQASIKRD
jgi:hypothetical protein